VEGALGDFVDVVGIEVAELLVEGGLFSGRELVIEGLVFLLARKHGM
jgi:hypothetical protein